MSTPKFTLSSFTNLTAGSLCSLSFHPSGQHVAACGGATVKIFDSNNLITSIESIDQHTDSVASVAFLSEGEGIVSAGADRFVRISSFPSGDPVTTVTRTALAVRHVAVQKTGLEIAVCGEEDGVRVLRLKDVNEWEVAHVLKGHQGTTKSVDFHPSKRLLASSGCDGSVRVWDLETGVQKANLPILPKTDFSSQNLGRTSWSPDGLLLAVPTYSNISFVDVNSLKTVSSCKSDSGHSKDISVVSWSPNGLYIASAGMDNKVLIWNFATRTIVAKYQHECLVADLCWNPVGNSVAMIDSKGKLALWDSIVPSSLPHPARAIAASEAATATSSSGPVDPALLDPEEDEEQPIRTGKASIDPASSDEPVDRPHAPRRLTRANAPPEPEPDVDARPVEDGDDLVSDIDEYEPERDSPARRQTTRFPMALSANVTKPQAPFQPGSTPKSRSMNHRFLAYNMVGAIISRAEEGFSSVEIEFQDTERHRTIRLNDRHNFHVAALSEHGAIFGSAGTSQSGSALFYKPFDSWTSGSEWLMNLPTDESVIAVATGRKWACAATSRHFLRLFSESGVQLSVISASHVVAMAGHEKLLAVVSHRSAPIGENQNLEYRIYDVSTNSEVRSGSLCISSGSTLRWIGFSDQAQLSAMDSTGVLRVLTGSFGGQWVPVFDSVAVRKHVQDTYWPVGITSGSISDKRSTDDLLTCILCKNGEDFPRVLPRPSMTALPLSVPLLNPSSAFSTFEESFHKGTLQLERLKDNKAPPREIDSATLFTDTLLIRHLAAACKSDKGARALDVCEQIKLTKCLHTAVQLVAKLRMPILAEKAHVVLQERLRKDSLQETEEEEDSQESVFSASRGGSHRPTGQESQPSGDEASEEPTAIPIPQRKASSEQPAKREASQPPIAAPSRPVERVTPKPTVVRSDSAEVDPAPRTAAKNPFALSKTQDAPPATVGNAISRLKTETADLKAEAPKSQVASSKRTSQSTLFPAAAKKQKATTSE